MDIIVFPTWSEYTAELMSLINDVARWLTGSYLGNLVLVFALVFIGIVLMNTLSVRDPLFDSEPWED